MTKKTLKYFISVVIALTVFSNLNAQKDTVARKHFFRINLDLASPIYSNFFDKANHRSGYEAMAEYSFNDTLFFIMEAGFHQLHCNLTTDKTYSTYESVSHGEFLRVGVNRNLMKYYNHKDRDIFYVGLRLSGSSYNMTYSSIIVPDAYWGGNKELSTPLQYYWGFWSEAVLGMRIETAKNLFLGWDVRGAFKLYDSNQSTFKTLFIPGYGNPQNPMSVWLNYSIGYAF